jgi:hypothetical protein
VTTTRTLPTFNKPITNNSTDQNPSWYAASSSARKEIPSILYNLLVHHRVHKSSPLVLTLRHINPVHTLLPYFFKIRFNIIVSFSPRSSKWPPSLRFPLSRTRATCPANYNLLRIINRIIFGCCCYNCVSTLQVLSCSTQNKHSQGHLLRRFYHESGFQINHW